MFRLPRGQGLLIALQLDGQTHIFAGQGPRLVGRQVPFRPQLPDPQPSRPGQQNGHQPGPQFPLADSDHNTPPIVTPPAMANTARAGA